MNAQASSRLKSVSDMRLWQENQPENVRKAAGARQHLSDDTDVDQCTSCTVQLLYAVRFQVGRLYAQCTWSCFTHEPRSVRVTMRHNTPSTATARDWSRDFLAMPSNG